MRDDLPTGTVTFLFTDVEGSTQLLHELGAEAYDDALIEHRRVIREACNAEGGVEVDTQGDAFFFAFPTAPGAVAAAEAMTKAFASGRISVRIGLHTGIPHIGKEGYVGDDVHFAARVAASGHGGQVILSAATAKLVELELTDLGEHRLKDISQAVPIFQLGNGSFPPLKTISNTNLPRPANSFVGRDDELLEVLYRFEAGARLVTLTGPGGTGKTRLAIEAASELVPEYKAGVFWVGLSTLRDPALVTETIGQTLGAKDGLTEHIAERELLLLLDNLEQVIDCAPELSGLLTTCPNLTLLVTSRELLRISGEVEYAVPPLAEAEAVSLFCERSQLDPDDTIAELCRRLDSLPLAVELAAARTSVLTPEQILERLSQRLMLKGSRDADPRQQTLRATIEWSYELLAPEEQRLFACLSVFAGGCTLEAAEEVAEADLDTLQSLVEKSLVRFTDGRYWMLETIREYASATLPQQADAREPLRRHATWFAALVEHAEAELELRDQRQWLERLDREHDNIRAALQWTITDGEASLALRLAAATATYWWIRGRLEEGGSWLDAARGIPGARASPLRSKALEESAHLAFRQGDMSRARALADEGVEVASAQGDGRRVARTLRVLALVAAGEGDESGFRRLVSESADAARASGDSWALMMALNNLGCAALEDGSPHQAAAHLKEAAALARANGDERGVAFVLENLAFASLAAGDLDGARADLARSLRLAHELGFREVLALDLTGSAAVAVIDGEHLLAARMLGSSERLLDEIGVRRDSFEQDVYVRTAAALEQALGSNRARAAVEEGRGLALEDVVALALDSLD